MGIYEEVDEFSKRWDATIARLIKEFPAEWSITGYKGHKTHDGVAWTATLRRSGKSVAYLEDSGTGGSVWTQFRDRDTDEAAWDAAITAALPGEKFEPDQMVIEALLIRAGK